MAKKNKNNSELIGNFLRDNNIQNVFIETVLDEMKIMEDIKDRLYREIQDGEIMEKYTNKFGATNAVVSAATKEYKNYLQKYNELIKNLWAIAKEDILNLPKEKQEESKLFQIINKKAR
jgi:hypothetical protein